MKAIEYVKMINGFFCGLTSAGLIEIILGILRNNIHAKLQGTILFAVGLPVVVVTAVTWYYLNKEVGEAEK